MAADVTKTQHPALIVPDPRWTYADAYDSTDSSLTQAGPIPGVPVAQQDTGLALETTGTQSASKQLRVRTLRGGFPEADGTAFGWRYQGDTLYRGWNPPTSIQAWQCLDYTTTASKWLWPHAIRLQSGVLLIAVQQGGNAISVWLRTTAGVWSNVAVATHGTYTYGGFPTATQLDSGRILLYAWWENGTANQVHAFYSDDDGATWGGAGNGVLPAALTTSGMVTPARLRAVTANGQVLLVAGVRDTGKAYYHYLKQYASNDGYNFTLVDTWAATSVTTHAAYHDLVVVNGVFYLGYLANSANANPRGRRVANAFTPLSSATEIFAYETAVTFATSTAGVVDCTITSPQQGDYALAVDEDGILYATGRNTGGSMDTRTYRSIDGGVTWNNIGSSAAGAGGTWWNIGSANRYPHGFAMVASMGRLAVVHNFVASADAHDPSLCVAWIGGYTTVCLPVSTVSQSMLDRVSWERTWLPFDLPNTGATFTLTSVGAPTIALASGALTVQGGLGDQATYSVAPTSTFAQGVLALWDGAITSGTVLLTVRVGAAGPVDHSVTVIVTATGISVQDDNGPVSLTVEGGGGTFASTLGTGGQILIAIGNSAAVPANDGNVYVWGRARTSTCTSDAAWTLICHSSTITLGAAAATNYAAFGNASVASTNIAHRAFLWTYGSYTGASGYRLYSGQSNPADLLGRFFSAASPVYVDDGVRVRALDGPAGPADLFNIDTDYTYPIRNLWPEVAPSPRRTWRSTSNATQDIVWYADPDTLTEETVGLRGTRALIILGGNFRNAVLSGYDVTGASYVTIATIDMATGMTGLRWARGGSLLRVDTSGSSSAVDKLFQEHALAGSHVKLDGTPNYRKIRTNSAGAWTATTTQRVRLTLANCAAGDPATGTAGEIWSQAAVVILSDTDSYSRYRLRLTSQTTAGGYFEIGSLLWGHLVPFASRPAWNRVLTTAQNTRTTTMESGTRSVVSLGPPRRRVELAWTEGTDLSQGYGTTPVPDYILPYTGATDPIATPVETPGTLAGLVGQLGGAGSLVGYVGKWVPPGSASVFFLNDPDQILVGRLTGDPRITTMMGHEYANPGEVVSIAGVVLDEET